MLECFVLLSLLVLAVVFQDEDNLDANEIRFVAGCHLYPKR